MAAGLASSPPPSNAALFGTCTILVNSSGKLTASADLTQLSSRNPGGVPARATVVANGGGGGGGLVPSLLCSLDFLVNCFSVSVAPAGFAVRPPGLGSDVDLSSSFDFDGAVGLISHVVLNGTYLIDLHMTAKRSGAMLPVGSYQTQSTVTCQ